MRPRGTCAAHQHVGAHGRGDLGNSRAVCKELGEELQGVVTQVDVAREHQLHERAGESVGERRLDRHALSC